MSRDRERGMLPPAHLAASHSYPLRPPLPPITPPSSSHAQSRAAPEQPYQRVSEDRYRLPSINELFPTGSLPQDEPATPDYSRVRVPTSGPWAVPDREPKRASVQGVQISSRPAGVQGVQQPRRYTLSGASDSTPFAYSHPHTSSGPSPSGPPFTPPSSSRSRPPSANAPPSSAGQPSAYFTPVAVHPPHAHGHPPPPSPGIALEGPYYLPSHPYTTIFFAPPNQLGPARNARACVKCRKRKVRCSAANTGFGFPPVEASAKCERCERAGEECVFEDRAPVKRKSKTGSSTTEEDFDDRDVEEGSSRPSSIAQPRTPASPVASFGSRAPIYNMPGVLRSGSESRSKGSRAQSEPPRV